MSADRASLPPSAPPPARAPNLVPLLSASERLRIGPYELVARFVGEGKSDVFLARKSTELGFIRLAVVKLATRRLPQYEQRRQILYDEARAIAFLDHSNLVTILDAGESEHGTFLALEYFDGTDLESVNAGLRARGEALPFELACHVSAEVLRALHHAHSAASADGSPLRIVHRDVNPSNVIISHTGHVKLTDFSVVHMNDRLQEATKVGVIKGALAYVAPEYLEGRASERTMDIYSVGVMLFELLTGRRCFTGASPYELMQRILAGEFRFERLEREGVPNELRRVVEKATFRSPADRFTTAEDMANALESWIIRSTRHVSAWILSAFFRQHGLFDPGAEERNRALAGYPLPSPSRSGPPGPGSAAAALHAPAAFEMLQDTLRGDSSASNLLGHQALPALDRAKTEVAPRGPARELITSPETIAPQILSSKMIEPAPPLPPPLPVAPRSPVSSPPDPPRMHHAAQGLLRPPPAVTPLMTDAPLPEPLDAFPGRGPRVPPPLASTTPQSHPEREVLGFGEVITAPNLKPLPQRVGHYEATQPGRFPPRPSQAPGLLGQQSARSSQPAPRPSQPTYRASQFPPAPGPTVPAPPDAQQEALRGSSPPQRRGATTDRRSSSPGPAMRPWSGDLATTSPADVLSKLVAQRASGIIEFRFGLLWKKLALRKGEVLSISSNSGMEMIGEQLVEARLLSRQDLDRALRESLAGTKTFIERLLDLQLVERAKLEAHLGKNIADRLRAVLTWQQGTFDFVAGPQVPPAVLPSLDLAGLLSRFQSEKIGPTSRPPVRRPSIPSRDD